MDSAHFLIVRDTPAFRRLSLAMLAAGFSTFAMLYGVQPLLPLFADEYRLTAAEASLAISIATAPLAFMILIAGLLSDRIGRRPMMLASLFTAALLTLAIGLLPGWTTLLALRFLTGIALAGIPAVAMAFIADEVEPSSIPASMGLYIAGSALGGMAGRLGVSVVAEYAGWRPSFVLLGISALLSAIAFWRLSPTPRGFIARSHDPASVAAAARHLLGDPGLRLLFTAGALLMGIFVTIYNFAGFRLLAPPYLISHAAVGAIFLLYILGSVSSTFFGALASRLTRRRVVWMPALILLAGVLITAAQPLFLIIIGIGLLTMGVFGLHSIASAWVSHRAGSDRSLAAAIYLSCYYIGGSVMGPIGGIAWAKIGWPGVVLFTGVLGTLVMIVALRLTRIAPLPQNRLRPEDEPELPPG